MQNDSHFDVIIVGGGPAGCATILSLFKHSQKLRCMLIDDSDPQAFKIGESLPPEAAQLLYHLHPSLSKTLTQQVVSKVHSLCTGNASIWASSEPEERHAILNPFGHGLHLDRAAFDEMMRESVVQLSHQHSRIALSKCRLVDLQSNGESWTIRTKFNEQVKTSTTRWVIDASGRKASVATKLGIKTVSSSLLLAFYALFIGPSLTDPAEGDNDNRTLIEATPDGWFYSSLLSRSPCTRVVAFHTLSTHPAAKQSRRREGFLDLLQATAPNISQIVNNNDYTMVRKGGYPRCMAAGSSYLDKTCDVKTRWIAVGDAAIAFDPLSSQGMMTALEMGFYVGAMLAERVEDGEVEPGFDGQIDDMYRIVREDYERHRGYYYSIVKRFQGEAFWENVCP